MKRRFSFRSTRLVSLLLSCLLLTLAYFPIARIFAAGAKVLPSSGTPLVNLKNPGSLKVAYNGTADAVAVLKAGKATPTALAAADFDADGAMDVVAGYSTGTGGVLVLLRGNPDAYAPKDTSLYQKAMQGNVPATFLPKANVIAVPVSPDLVTTGDFNRDGYQDVLVAARGGSLYLLAGDGRGGLLAPQSVELGGKVMALAVADDGHAAVSLEGAKGPELAILSPSTKGLTASATFALPGQGDAVAWGNLGGGADLAVGAGNNVVVIYGALSGNPQTETIGVPFQARALALGDFIWDRDGRLEIAALTGDGTVQILQHGTLDTRPLTPADIPGRRAALIARSMQPPDATSIGAWSIAKQLTYSGSVPSGPVSPSAFSSPRLAESTTHDLMVLDAGRNQVNILDTSGAAANSSAGISFASTPVAALALPQKINAGRDVVVLTSGQVAPTIVTAGPSGNFNVTTTADEDDAGACPITSSVTSGAGPDGVLSLREAVCEANNRGAATSTINVPAGTYSLSISTFGGGGSAFSSFELQAGMQNGNNITITGAGASSTIIQQLNTTERVLEQDEILAGNIPITISNLRIMGGHCTTGLDCTFGGGGVLATGTTGDNFTANNVLFSGNNSGATDNGGAVASSTFGNMSFSNVTVSNNGATQALGGGLYFNVGAGGSGNLGVTNSTFTNNVSSAGTSAGEGGGLLAFSSVGSTVAIAGSTFTGNQAQGLGALGGAIIANLGAIVSNSRIVGNTATLGSGYYETGGAGNNGTVNHNWWGCNAGPNNTGCDHVDVSAGSTATFHYVLQLFIFPTFQQTLPGATTGVEGYVIDGQTCNGYVGNSCYVPDGTPVSFSPGALVTITSADNTFTSGDAFANLLVGSTAGHDTPSVTVDNQTVSGTIEVLDTVTVDTSPTGLPITVDGTAYTAPQTFNWIVGSSHTIATTSPQSGPPGTQYVFDNWSDSGAISHTVSAPVAPTTYTANFDTQYQLTTQASPSADGTVAPASGGYYASGATIPVTATANAGFQFNNWTSTGGTFDSTTSASTNFHMPAAPATVTGNFGSATVQITIATIPANLLVSADGGPSTPAPLVETWVAGSSHTIATTSPQSGGPGVQLVWSNWSDSGPISHGITVPGTPTTYTASFGTQYQLTTQASPPADGTVAPASGSYFASGSTIPVTATANAGFQFVNWTSTGGAFDSTISPSTNFHMPAAPATVTGNFTTIILATPTTTSVSSNNDPSFTSPPGNSVTFTATVTSNTTVNEGTVTFSDPANNFTCSGGNTVPVSNGQAACTTSFTSEGANDVTGAYNGTVNFQASSGDIIQTVNNHTVVTGNQFCNPGAIAIPSAAGAATPYPSNIFVTGLGGNIGAVTVKLNNISSSNIQQTDLLLVGPTGAAIVPFANVGDGSSISVVNITLDDSASGLIPGGSPLTSGSYKPTSITGSTSLIFPAPAPSLTVANYAATDGSATLSSTFQNTAPNGTWALYAMDNSGGGPATIGGGWCVNISAPTTQVTITTNPANLLVSVDGGGASPAPLIENWVIGSTHTIATSSPQAGGTGVQYVWNNWSDGGTISHSILVPSSPAVYTANFDTQYLLTASASPANGGSVTPATPTFYNAGTNAPITATAAAGYAFTSWTSSPGTVANPLSPSTTIAMNAPESVTANFVPVVITVTPASIDFGQGYINKPKTKHVTVKNHGMSSVTINGVSITPGLGTNPGDFTFVNNCPPVLGANKSCQIQVTSAAVDGGTLSATLNVADSAPGSPQQVSLSAVVIDRKAKLSPNSLYFAKVTVGNSLSLNTFLTNTGSQTLTIFSITVIGNDPGDFTPGGDCGPTLAPGNFCTISVTFAPSATGQRTAKLLVTDDAQMGKQTATLSGKGQ